MTKAVESPKSVGMSARRLERVRPAMQAYVDRGVYAGINTLIARRGKVVHREQFGWRDKEAQSPMSADAIFRLYSMTKPIVCTGLMTLLEEARFTLFDPVAKYHSGVWPREGARSRRQSGQSGAPRHAARSDDPHERPDLPFRRRIPRRQRCISGPSFSDAKCSLEAAIDDLTQFPLAFQPGSRWRYSVGIDVVARVIEVDLRPSPRRVPARTSV